MLMVLSAALLQQSSIVIGKWFKSFTLKAIRGNTTDKMCTSLADQALDRTW